MFHNSYKKGFTLVELIVVSVIIAILMSIAIFTYSQKSIYARNTLRTYDISVINRIIGTKIDINAIPLSRFIETLSALHTFGTGTVFGGIPIISTSYAVGTPNKAMFGNEAISDPNTNDPYIIGYTQGEFGSYYQVAGSLEIQTAIVDGIYYQANVGDLPGIIKDPTGTGAVIKDSNITPY